MDWITDQIAIGNFLDAKNAASFDVDAILCLKSGCCCNENNPDMAVVCIPLVDGLGNSKRSIINAVGFIDDVVSHEERILVHCHAGASRSACIVARYLMFKENISAREAIAKIQTKRKIYLSPGIEDILED